MLKVLKALKGKKSHGFDGISSEVLKLGAEALAEPLAFIINYSILTGTYPTRWKISKVIPLHKKKDRKSVENYRPVALLCTSGMVLERMLGIQLERHFEDNNLLGNFQYGFRRNRSTILELITLFDTLLDAKQEKKEVLLLLYDLSAAFDCISHQTLLGKQVK